MASNFSQSPPKIILLVLSTIASGNATIFGTTTQASALERLNTQWVQRLDTTGGNLPLESCNRDRQNAEISVPYTANYYFYSPTKVSAANLITTR